MEEYLKNFFIIEEFYSSTQQNMFLLDSAWLEIWDQSFKWSK